MVHNYKLKLTVDNTEYLADINWTKALDNVFNKRCRRINDYGNSPSGSVYNTLSGHLTAGVAIANSDVPMIPKQSFAWVGKRKKDDTEYTYDDYSGTVGKVAIVSEVIANNPDKTYYTMGFGGMLKDKPIGQFQSIPDVIGRPYYPLGYAKNLTDVICINSAVTTPYNDYNVMVVEVPKTKWGLDGVEYTSMYKKSTDLDNIRTSKTHLDNCFHNYPFNSAALEELFERDEQTESETISGQTVSYITWNCLFFLRNDFYGTTKGDSVTHSEDYIFVNEYLAAKVIRVGQYNNPNFPYEQYPFKPSNCDIYFNMTTRQFEEMSSNQNFDVLLNYEVVSKEDYNIVASGSAMTTNVIQLDFTQLNYTAGSATYAPSTFGIEANNFADETYILNNKLPFRMFSAYADDEKVYLVSGYASNNTNVFSYRVEDILQSPNTINFTNENVSDIQNFFHTKYRDSLFVRFAYPVVHTPDITSGKAGYEVLINKETAIVDEWGYFDWLCSGVADFGNVQIQSGQTFKFELVEVLTND